MSESEGCGYGERRTLARGCESAILLGFDVGLLEMMRSEIEGRLKVNLRARMNVLIGFFLGIRRDDDPIACPHVNTLIANAPPTTTSTQKHLNPAATIHPPATL